MRSTAISENSTSKFRLLLNPPFQAETGQIGYIAPQMLDEGTPQALRADGAWVLWERYMTCHSNVSSLARHHHHHHQQQFSLLNTSTCTFISYNWFICMYLSRAIGLWVPSFRPGKRSSGARPEPKNPQSSQAFQLLGQTSANSRDLLRLDLCLLLEG